MEKIPLINIKLNGSVDHIPALMQLGFIMSQANSVINTLYKGKPKISTIC